MKVYWGTFERGHELVPGERFGNLGLAYHKPDPLIRNISEEVKLSDYAKCPAFTDVARNTFVLRSPINIKFKVFPKQRRLQASNPHVFQSKFDVTRLFPSGVFQYLTSYLFFSEKPMKMHQVHPYLHFNSFTENANALTGCYDCGQWFRPIQGAFVCDMSKNEIVFDIKRGDPYCYISFDTDEKVQLQKFYLNNEIETLIQQTTQLKEVGKVSPGKVRPMSMAECYKQFSDHSARQRLINLFEEQNINDN